MTRVGYNLSDPVFSPGKLEQNQVTSKLPFSSKILNMYAIIIGIQSQVRYLVAIQNIFKLAFIFKNKNISLIQY